MFKSLFKEDRKLVSVNVNNLQGEKKYMQSGHIEADLVCAECDNVILGGLERYASNHLYRQPTVNSGVTRTEYGGNHELIPYIRYENLDYVKIKLFFLSILWRCHISKNLFFSDVDLGSHSEIIRKMILENNPGKDDDYEVILIFIDTAGSRPSKSVIDPIKIKQNGNTFYVFHINEIMYHFNVSKHNKIEIFNKGAIRRDNILDIAVLNDKVAREHFDMYLGRRILMKSNVLY
ncbi:hypothetical protein [uncultured Algoriphagus sp.]|uniref:hypothetical protein n=1 Tax=uncultured Algoriphagus sp. TaxID=417365 RepID=UPI0030EF4081